MVAPGPVSPGAAIGRSPNYEPNYESIDTEGLPSYRCPVLESLLGWAQLCPST
jgi:hypothetical protein